MVVKNIFPRTIFAKIVPNYNLRPRVLITITWTTHCVWKLCQKVMIPSKRDQRIKINLAKGCKNLEIYV